MIYSYILMFFKSVLVASGLIFVLLMDLHMLREIAGKENASNSSTIPEIAMPFLVLFAVCAIFFIFRIH